MRITVGKLCRLLAALLLVTAGVLAFGVRSASATPQVSCGSYQPGPPYNNYTCYLPKAQVGHEVYLQAFPKQNEVDCSNPPFTQAEIHVQIAAIRYTTGFHITGLWIQYDYGHTRYIFAQASVEDGNHHYPQGPWNHYGDWNRDDFADKYTGDPIRSASAPARPTMSWFRGAATVKPCCTSTSKN